MQKVAELSQLREDRGVRVRIGETEILLVRDGEAVRAYSARCPHAGAPLDEGAVCGGRIICPWHKASFRLEDGTLLEPPALDPLTRYGVAVRGREVFVDAAPLPTPASPPGPPPGAPDARTVLIVGSGAAGGTAAAALREFGFCGRILLAGPEGPPFDRTALSKFVLAGQMAPEAAPPLRPEGFYAAHRIEPVAASVRRLDPASRRAVLEDGRQIGFDVALLATGGVPKSVGIQGADLAGVRSLRTRGDAAAILADVREGTRVVILGASFIGLEVAASLTEQRADIAVVAPVEVPFAPQFGAEIGGALLALHRSRGIRFHLPQEAVSIEGETRVRAVRLGDGTRLPADLVVVGVGVRPATDLFACLCGEDGTLAADAAMRVADGLYAAGDIVSFPLPDQRRVRVEHWRVAQQQARIAARNIAAANDVATYDDVPFFWTYHYGHRIEYLGHAERWDAIEIDGVPADMNFLALVLQEGRVAAAIACQRERQMALLAQAMRRTLTQSAARDLLRGG